MLLGFLLFALISCLPRPNDYSGSSVLHLFGAPFRLLNRGAGRTDRDTSQRVPFTAPLLWTATVACQVSRVRKRRRRLFARSSLPGDAGITASISGFEVSSEFHGTGQACLRLHQFMRYPGVGHALLPLLPRPPC